MNLTTDAYCLLYVVFDQENTIKLQKYIYKLQKIAWNLDEIQKAWEKKGFRK